jgi:hypothetical protein
MLQAITVMVVLQASLTESRAFWNAFKQRIWASFPKVNRQLYCRAAVNVEKGNTAVY